MKDSKHVRNTIANLIGDQNSYEANPFLFTLPQYSKYMPAYPELVKRSRFNPPL
jgi:hypothetical protein